MEPQRIIRIIDSYVDFFVVGLSAVTLAGQIIRAFPDLSTLGYVVAGFGAIAFGLVGGFYPQSRPMLAAILAPCLLGVVFAWGV